MHKSRALLTIFLVWASAGLSHISCAPIINDGATTGSDLQLAKVKQPDETSRLEVERVRIPTGVSNEPAEIDIYVHTSPSSQISGEQSGGKGHDHDGNEMFKFWFDMYLEFIKCLWSLVQSLASAVAEAATFFAQQVLPLALFLVACTATILVAFGLVTTLLGCLGTLVSDGRYPTERTRLL